MHLLNTDHPTSNTSNISYGTWCVINGHICGRGEMEMFLGHFAKYQRQGQIHGGSVRSKSSSSSWTVRCSIGCSFNSSGKSFSTSYGRRRGHHNATITYIDKEKQNI